MRILEKYLKQLKDTQALEQSYDISIADHMLPRKQFPSRAGIQTILDELTERNPKARQAKPEDFIDIRFIQQLDESGYIEQLYAHK